MSQVTFYILAEDQTHNIPAQIAQACHLAAFYYQQQTKVFIYTENKEDAFIVDEYLWQFDGDSFVAHNLMGEGPRFGSPVEISWEPTTQVRPVLINLSSEVPEFSKNFKQIIDFVPVEETLKMTARRRYSAYKKLGHTLSTTHVESLNSINKIEDK
ncbi:DNA polymerase III chi subunit, HolC [Psychromonas sp. CNPT3]|uniref:DNA polymerase III subunit chi n=1 Tax=Psychromonas sp. CNPT3 TaxID=314282 RepID=UPI00006E50A3|nr:DNA polymerase III subunit chi [Psychromonas sp. CNPT3]AGH80479.1 DNA polymerase III chi subunit, HolC [Psychromonas sp. CNPT3]